MVFSGFCSILERKMLALIHLRIGPGIMLFWLLLPLVDGLKLFFKFLSLVVMMNLFVMIFICLCSLCSSYIMWGLFPLGLVLLLELSFSFFVVMIFHVMFDVCVVFVVCFFLVSCFVYLSCLRYVLFGLFLEVVVLVMLYVFFVLDYSFCYKDLMVSQLLGMNLYFFGFVFVLFSFVVLLFELFRLPFDYVECESELVAGFKGAGVWAEETITRGV